MKENWTLDESAVIESNQEYFAAEGLFPFTMAFSWVCNIVLYNSSLQLLPYSRTYWREFCLLICLQIVICFFFYFGDFSLASTCSIRSHTI